MTDTYVINSAGKPIITKDPSAVLDYVWDWTAWLALITDTINTKTIYPTAPIVEVSSSIIGNVKVSAFLSGGVAGNTYPVTCRIVTVGGRTDERTIYLKVKER